MSNEALIEAFADRIYNGLQKKSVRTCSKWAEKYRVMGAPFPGKWTFDHHPWTKSMHDSEAEVNVGQKSAQVGYTETVLNRTFYNLDIRGLDVLYILPSKTPDASDFSSARFDTALELSPYLENLFSDVKNIGHKKAGNNNLYIRGGRSRGGLKSIPVGCLVIDEVDEIPEKNIPLARERLSGQVVTDTWLISTPTIPEYGINKYFQQSTQNHYFFRCPSCSKFIELKWPESFVVVGEHYEDPRTIESHHICYECKNKLINETKINWLGFKNNGRNGTAEWVPQFQDNADMEGWYINQLYGMTKATQPQEIAKSYLMSLTDPFAEQEFHNSKLGLAHVVEGARVTEKDIKDCQKGYIMADHFSGGSLVTMGVDVGKMIHVEINQWMIRQMVGSDINLNSIPRLLYATKVMNFEDLDPLMVKYSVSFAVLDRYPETRKALEFVMRFFGRARLCEFSVGIGGKFIHDTSETEATVKVDRTTWLDLALNRFKANTIQLPQNIPLEYKDQVQIPVRVYEKDSNGNPVARYVSTKADHYAFARCYSEIALPLAIKIAGTHQNIGSVL